MAGKYTPLEIFLRDTLATKQEVTLTFGQIEKILDSTLPDSANELSWWEHETEGNHVNTRAWANAGWSISQVNLQEKWVRFTRAK